MKKLLDYFLEINKIKDVERYTVHHKVFHESVADHSFMMIVLATKFIDELNLDLDFKKVIELVTNHDFCEIGLSADYDAVAAKVDAKYYDEKKSFETQNIEKFSNRYGKKMLMLHDEYVKQETREAKFVKALDKLETNIYEVFRGVEYFGSPDFIALYPKKAVMAFPELIPFYKEFLVQMKQLYEKTGYAWKEEYDV